MLLAARDYGTIHPSQRGATMGEGIYLAQFFRLKNPFLALGVLWFVLFGAIALFYYVPAASETEKMQRFLGRLARVLPAGVAGLTGWIAFGYLWVIDWRESRWEYSIVAAVAFLGITGFLPWAVAASRLIGFGDPARGLQPVQVQGTLDLRVQPPS